MPIVFVDTVAWIALVNTRDSLHDKAKEVFARLRAQNYQFVTTEFVLLEFANALSAPLFVKMPQTLLKVCEICRRSKSLRQALIYLQKVSCFIKVGRIKNGA